jgi:hypothetical protein
MKALDRAAEPGTSAVRLLRLHAQFLSLLPRIETHARVYFRHVRCTAKKADAIQETIALAWSWYVRLVLRGKDPHAFASALATYAARQVNCGRGLCGQQASKDALSPLAQRRHGFFTQSLPAFDIADYGSPALEALQDNTVTPPPDQAAFRIDFPSWLAELGDRNRRLAEELALGEKTFVLADKYGLTAGRVSQLRRELHEDWCRFHGEPVVP